MSSPDDFGAFDEAGKLLVPDFPPTVFVYMEVSSWALVLLVQEACRPCLSVARSVARLCDTGGGPGEAAAAAAAVQHLLQAVDAHH